MPSISYAKTNIPTSRSFLPLTGTRTHSRPHSLFLLFSRRPENSHLLATYIEWIITLPVNICRGLTSEPAFVEELVLLLLSLYPHSPSHPHLHPTRLRIHGHIYLPTPTSLFPPVPQVPSLLAFFYSSSSISTASSTSSPLFSTPSNLTPFLLPPEIRHHLLSTPKRSPLHTSNRPNLSHLRNPHSTPLLPPHNYKTTPRR